MKRARVLVWALMLAAVVLATRVFVYALVPQSLVVAELEHKTGNPHVLVASLAAAGAALVVAIAVLGFAVVAVRERLALEGRRVAEVTPPRLRTLAMRWVALAVTSSVTFAYLESYIHWREGLGWHGLHCLVGPVHRNAIPVLIAFSLVAVALHAAIEHLVAWARRLVITLAARLPRILVAGARPLAAVAARCVRLAFSQGSPRGPPWPAVPVSTV
jgi:hypothetical protein